MKTVPASFNRAIKVDPQERMESFRMQTAEVGTVDVHHASFVVVGEVERDGDARPTITVGVGGCRCGCNAPGTAMLYTPPIEHLRTLAGQLTEMADRFEREATAAVDAAIAKARGK